MGWPGIVLKLAAALVAGGLVGLEREISGKAAGLRTNILICEGATVMAALGISLAQLSSESGKLVSDPQRMGAGIITGIGFLGAGAILQSRGTIRGMTTAATIWILAGIGLAIGSGEYVLAAAATLITVGTLFGLEKVERRLPQGVLTVEYRLEGEPEISLVEEAEQCARGLRAEVHDLRVECSRSQLTLHFVARASPRVHRKLALALLGIEKVHTIKQG
ncbi:MAG TPA: MgtC/SapB family protein [Candidatus Saccharimonadales bacterium]|nr:MgtC/SapB family protein [Candidatus Saccharimonadales bacterium]